MSLDIDSLRKVLELERKKGYTDAAVIGGLERFLRNWSAQALKSGATSLAGRFQELRLSEPDYTSLTGEQRKAWLGEVLRFLTGLEAGAVTETSVSPPPSPTRRRVKPKPTPPPAVASGPDSPITVLRGISASLAAKFQKLGVVTIRDLLYFFPHRHLDYSRIKHISHYGNMELLILKLVEQRP